MVVNNFKERLKKTLENIQSKINGHDLSITRLESFAAEIKKAFDDAIDFSERKKNLLEEIQRNRAKLKQWRRGFFRTIYPINFRYLVSAPFIYMMIVPSVIFHIFLEVYHQICFRLYRIPLVDPEDYFFYDRHLLPYLNWFEKSNCLYCSYVNNLILYAQEIGGRTERFWCPIKHAKRQKTSHSHYTTFLEYGDAEKFRTSMEELRNFDDVKTTSDTCDFIEKRR